MPRILGICFVALIGIALASCNNKDKDIDDYEATLKLLQSNSQIDVKAAAGSTGRLVFSSDYDWKIETEDATVDWLTFEPRSGEASSRITVKITADENNGPVRTAKCNIVSGASTLKFTVRQDIATVVLDEADIEDYEKIYKPKEFNFDRKRSDSQWSFCRSKQSEHFIVFWSKEYGEHGLYGDPVTSPSTLAPSHSMYVDIDDLLEKAEVFFDVNVNKLKFAELGNGTSNFDNYKIGIYLTYTTEWMAYGGGYDDFIGALWINPATCHPVGSTIAHEIGHSFQYQVYADKISNGLAAADYSTGWRYEIGQGATIWEQCAQWQSYQSYAEQAFTTVNFTEFVNNCHRHFIHEHQRYASYFLQWYWAEKHGVEMIGELWRRSEKPEDMIQTYQKVQNLSMDQLNAELYDYAAKCTTWDFEVETTNIPEGKLAEVTPLTQTVKEFGKDYIGRISWTGNYDEATDTYSVAASRAPEATGFNHLRLNTVDAGTEVSVEFKGIVGTAGYNAVSDASIAGWHCGYVALLNDGTRVYTEPVKVSGPTASATVSYTVPEGCKALWFVVAATPSKYLTHYWDENNDNDEVWPFSVKITNTDLYGNIKIDPSMKPQNATITKSVTMSAAAGYAGPSVTLDGDDLIVLAKAFAMLPSDIAAKLPANRDDVQKGEIKFAGVNSDGSLSYNFTANVYGHWVDDKGDVNGWSSSYVYSEFDISSWHFQLGCHPDKVSAGTIKAGDEYVIRQALVYPASDGNEYRATIEFNITMVD